MANTVAADPFIQVRTQHNDACITVHELAADIRGGLFVFSRRIVPSSSATDTTYARVYLVRPSLIPSGECGDRRAVSSATAASASCGSACRRIAAGRTRHSQGTVPSTPRQAEQRRCDSKSSLWEVGATDALRGVNHRSTITAYGFRIVHRPAWHAAPRLQCCQDINMSRLSEVERLSLKSDACTSLMVLTQAASTLFAVQSTKQSGTLDRTPRMCGT